MAWNDFALGPIHFSTADTQGVPFLGWTSNWDKPAAVTPQNKIQGSPTTGGSSVNDQLSAYNSQLDAQIRALQNQLATQPRPPKNLFDISGAYDWAAKQAASVVNPYYQEQFNQYLNRTNQLKTQQQNAYENSLTDLQKNLERYMQDATTQQGRAGEDVQYNMGQIQGQEQQRQQVEAKQYDSTRRNLQDQLGQAGLTYSGLGRQQVAQSDWERQQNEVAQTRAVEDKKYLQNLTYNRTLEDIAKGTERSKSDTETGKTRAKMSLDEALQGIEFDLQSKKWDLETQRQQAEMQKQNEFYQQKLSGYLKGITNPYELAWASSVYK